MEVLIATKVDRPGAFGFNEASLCTADASDHFHVAVLTQILIEDLEKP